jgi:hypothetical protein
MSALMTAEDISHSGQKTQKDLLLFPALVDWHWALWRNLLCVIYCDDFYAMIGVSG